MKWHLTWTMDAHPDGIDRAEVEANGLGACDAAVILSIVLPDDGSYSQKTIGVDGKKGRAMTGDDLFRAWLLFGAALSDRPDLCPAQRTLTASPFDTWIGALQTTLKENVQ